MKFHSNKLQLIYIASPSLRGSGLKSNCTRTNLATLVVSLFTREWIEIALGVSVFADALRLPLYEGVD